jgi:hypothetical protein
MKGLVIFIHTPTDACNGWLNTCSHTLSSIIGQNSSEAVIVDDANEFFLILERNCHFGIYLPFISQKFLSSTSSMSVFEATKNNIELKYPGRALTLHVLEEVVSINLARVSPFFRFYAPCDSTEHYIISSLSLPGNHTQQSFYSSVHGLANEIIQLVTKESRDQGNGKCIFVATSTPDMEPYIRNLCNFLVYNFPEICIYNLVSAPGSNMDAYSIKISKLLKKCFLSIHIFGVSEDESVLKLPLFENALAAGFYKESSGKYYNDHAFKRLVWMPKAMDFSEKQQSFFADLKQNLDINAGAEMISSNLEEFKEIVFARIKKYEQNSISNNTFASQIAKPTKGKTGFVNQVEDLQDNCVYLIEGEGYGDTLNEIKALLSEANIPAYDSSCMPQGIDPVKWQSECLKKSIAVLILAGNWNNQWFRSNINEVRKARAFRDGQKYELVAVVSHEITVLPGDVEDFSVLIKLPQRTVKKDDLILLFNKLTTIQNIE